MTDTPEHLWAAPSADDGWNAPYAGKARDDDAIQYVRFDRYFEMQADRDALRAENERLKEQVVAYCGPWAVKYAEDRGLPKGHLHPTHYDDLANAGARMVSFTRAALNTKGGEAE